MFPEYGHEKQFVKRINSTLRAGQTLAKGKTAHSVANQKKKLMRDGKNHIE